jgi:ribosomal subunit interface protein
MHKRIIFRSMAYSDAIEKYIYKKIEKIYKFFKREPLPVNIDIMLEPHREKDYFKVEFKINSVRYHIAVQAKGLDMYAVIDEALNRIVKEITKKKEKMGHNLHFSYSV